MVTKCIIAFAAFYHVIATVAAMMSVFHFSRVMRGDEISQPLWRKIFSWGETHLWISGALLIVAGIYQSSLSEYLNNPKLWTKVSLVLIWGITSFMIQKTMQTASVARRNLMFGISTGSLLYGSFLGVAKPLAYGVLPFPVFLMGYVATIAFCTLGVHRLFALAISSSPSGKI